jgi:hypothetical protein
MRAADQRGQALPITVLLLAFAVVVAVGVARLAREVTLRSAAQHAADATALAGAVEGRHGAQAVAARNDATVVSFEQDGDVVVVTIERRGHHAQARAELVVEITNERETSPLPVGGG